MNASSDRVDDVIKSSVRRRLLLEKMGQGSVRRSQERIGQAESSQVSVAQSTVDNATSLQFAQFRFFARRFAIVDDDVAPLLLLGGETGESRIDQLGER